MELTGKTIGALSYLSDLTINTKIPVELNNETYYIESIQFSKLIAENISGETINGGLQLIGGTITIDQKPVVVSKYLNLGYSNLNSSINWSLSNTQELNLNNNPILSFENGTIGEHTTLLLKQQEIGLKTVTWPNSVIWNNNISPTLQFIETDGTEDTSFYTNLGDGFNSLISATSIQPDGKILVGGDFTELNGVTRNYLVRLNSDGTEDTDFYNNLGTGFNESVFTTLIQPDGKILVGGNFTSFNGNTRNGLVRLNSDGTEDTDFYNNLGTGFNSPINTISIQSDGKILVGGDFTALNGNTRNFLVRLNSNGTEDTSFYTNLGTGFGESVFTTSIQPDGKILVGGEFTALNGNTRNGLVRLNSDGTEDTDFYNNLGTGFNSPINTISIQSDGKILVGGNFTALNGNTRNFLVRLNSDGTEDTDFYNNLGTGFNESVFTTLIQPDGKILVGGSFTIFNGNTRNGLVRLNSNGTEDTSFYTNLGDGFNGYVTVILLNGYVGGNFTSFNRKTRNRLVRLGINYNIEDTDFYNNLGTGFDGPINTISIQSDGKILVGGSFNSFNENNRNRLVRLNLDGTEDTDFYNNLGTGFNNPIYTTSIQPDGKILVGGDFSALNGNTRNGLVRLNSNGTEDTGFYTNLGTGFDSGITGIRSVFVQTDGKILLGGNFTTFNENNRNYLVRLNSNGTEDTDFYNNLGTGFNSRINTISIQPDGKILVGGEFTELNGVTRNYLVRLNSDGTEDTSFYTNLGDGFNSPINTTSIQPDGKILVGGDFTSLNGNTRNRLVRLNSDGTEDTDFYNNLGTGFDGKAVFTTSIQPDGKILVGGDFTALNGNTRNFLVRLNSNGTEDTSFYTNLGTGFGESVFTTSIQPDGKILVGGGFTELNGVTRNYLVRLNSNVIVFYNKINFVHNGTYYIGSF